MNRKMLSITLIFIAVISFTSYFLIFEVTFNEYGIGFKGKESDFYVPAVKGENVSKYKNSCNELNLSQISKDPKALIGKKVKVTGQIYNKEEFEDYLKTRTNIILKVPELSPYPYILVTYTGTLPFKQGDNITVYGKYYYPAMDATVLEIKNKPLPNILAGYIEKA